MCVSRDRNQIIAEAKEEGFTTRTFTQTRTATITPEDDTYSIVCFNDACTDYDYIATSRLDEYIQEEGLVEQVAKPARRRPYQAGIAELATTQTK